MKFRVISLQIKREEKLWEKTAQKFTPQQAAEVCEVLESNKDPYKNAVRLYKMYRRANEFSNRVLDTPKLDGKPQDCTQPRSVSTSGDDAAFSTLQPRLARLEHHLCREQSSAIAGTSREAPVASLIDLCPPDQPQVPLSFDERRILTGETSIQGTSGLAHVRPVQADATMATAHSSGQPKPQGIIAPHSASGDIQGLAQPCATTASVKYSGGFAQFEPLRRLFY